MNAIPSATSLSTSNFFPYSRLVKSAATAGLIAVPMAKAVIGRSVTKLPEGINPPVPGEHRKVISTTQSGSSPDLFSQLAKGALTAGLITVPLSLAVTVIDRSVTKYNKGTIPSLPGELGKGISSVFKNPLQNFNRADNKAVFMTYCATYLAKNSSETFAKDAGVDPNWPIFVGSTIVNSPLSIRKDLIIAKQENPGATFALPLRSIESFIVRDGLVIGISFLAPAVVSPHLQSNFGWSKKTADIVAQIGCASAAQIPATPFHMLGLDFYNSPDSSLKERITHVARKSKAAIFTRMARQSVALGAGQIANKALFNYLTPAA